MPLLYLCIGFRWIHLFRALPCITLQTVLGSSLNVTAHCGEPVVDIRYPWCSYCLELVVSMQARSVMNLHVVEFDGMLFPGDISWTSNT